MTRRTVSDFIRTAVERLDPGTEYGRGRISEFTSIQNHNFPKVWHETNPEVAHVNPEINANLLPIDSWPVTLWIAQKDTEDSIPDQYEDIIDTADQVAQRLVFAFNNPQDADTAAQELERVRIQITDLSRSPFVKETSHCLTGVLLTFTLIAPDLTDHC